MNWEINFFIQNCLITFCAMAAVHCFLHANKTMPIKIKNKLLLLTFVLITESAEMYLEYLCSLPSDDHLAIYRVAISVFGYTVRPLMLYVVMLIMTRDVKWKWKNLILAIPTIVTLVIALLAFNTKWVFYYDERNNFHGGPLRYVFFAMLILYFVMILIANILLCKKNKDEAKVMFGIIALLSLDWILALVYDLIDMHASLETLCVMLYYMYFTSIFHSEEMEEKEKEYLYAEQLAMKEMLDQSIETLAYTIDAKDQYTKGHSSRVAKYSRMIAIVAGKSEEECRQIYLAGLLHDIGKISISGAIINKEGKLTTEEYEKIKSHPEKGAIILEKMKKIPFLQNGAKYHHERYDGKGYPAGLKGKEIPDMARIIAVADAYDAMTSYRSYRQSMDQNDVKQEIWKGMGTQFDPTYAKIMISLIDADPQYEMREFRNKQDEIVFDDEITKIVWPSSDSVEINGKKANPGVKSIQTEGLNSLAAFIKIEEKWGSITKGITVTSEPVKIKYKGITRSDAKYLWCVPLALVYASDDGEVLGPHYDELGVFITAGYGWQATISLHEHSELVREEGFENWDNWLSKNKEGLEHTVCIYKEKNKIVLSMENGLLTMSAVLVVPEDYKREIRIAFSGNECDVSDVRVV